MAAGGSLHTGHAVRWNGKGADVHVHGFVIHPILTRKETKNKTVGMGEFIFLQHVDRDDDKFFIGSKPFDFFVGMMWKIIMAGKMTYASSPELLDMAKAQTQAMINVARIRLEQIRLAHGEDPLRIEMGGPDSTFKAKVFWNGRLVLTYLQRNKAPKYLQRDPNMLKFLQAVAAAKDMETLTALFNTGEMNILFAPCHKKGDDATTTVLKKKKCRSLRDLDGNASKTSASNPVNEKDDDYDEDDDDDAPITAPKVVQKRSRKASDDSGATKRARKAQPAVTATAQPAVTATKCPRKVQPVASDEDEDGAFEEDEDEEGAVEEEVDDDEDFVWLAPQAAVVEESEQPAAAAASHLATTPVQRGMFQQPAPVHRSFPAVEAERPETEQPCDTYEARSPGQSAYSCPATPIDTRPPLDLADMLRETSSEDGDDQAEHAAGEVEEEPITNFLDATPYMDPMQMLEPEVEEPISQEQATPSPAAVPTAYSTHSVLDVDNTDAEAVSNALAALPLLLGTAPDTLRCDTSDVRGDLNLLATIFNESAADIPEVATLALARVLQRYYPEGLHTLFNVQTLTPCLAWEMAQTPLKPYLSDAAMADADAHGKHRAALEAMGAVLPAPAARSVEEYVMDVEAHALIKKTRETCLSIMRMILSGTSGALTMTAIAKLSMNEE